MRCAHRKTTFIELCTNCCEWRRWLKILDFARFQNFPSKLVLAGAKNGVVREIVAKNRSDRTMNPLPEKEEEKEEKRRRREGEGQGAGQERGQGEEQGDCYEE